MPYLSDEDRERYRQQSEKVCSDCERLISKAYCSRCDEFYEVGHLEGCRLKDEHRCSGQ